MPTTPIAEMATATMMSTNTIQTPRLSATSPYILRLRSRLRTVSSGLQDPIDESEARPRVKRVTFRAMQGQQPAFPGLKGPLGVSTIAKLERTRPHVCYG